MEATTTTMDPGDGEGAMASRSINGDGGAAAKVIGEEKKADGFVNGGAAVDTDGPKEPVVVDEAPVIGNGKAAEEEEVIKEEDREDAEEELKETAAEETKEAKAAAEETKEPLKEVKEDEQEEQVADIDANEAEEQVPFAEPEESKETKEADVEQTDQVAVAVEEKHAVQEKQDQVAEIGEAELDEKDADVPGEEVVKLAVEEDHAVDEREVKVVAVEQHVPVPEEKITNYQAEEKLADKVVEAKAQAVPQADHSHIVEAIALEAANLDGFGGGAAVVEAGDKTDEIEIIADEFIPDNAEANGDGSSSPRPNGGEVLEKKTRTRGLWSRCFPEFERPDPYSWTSAVALGVIAACSVVVISKHLRSLNANSNA